MRSVFIAACVVAASTLGTPLTATAQEPKRSPAQAPAPTQEPPGAPAAPRDVAVPRSAAPRAEVPRVETPRATTGEEGSRRRVPVSEVAPMPAPAASAAESDEQAQRRGAVRRPPSDSGRGDAGQAPAPRDRAVARTSRPPRDWDRDRGRDRIYYYPSYYSYGRYYDPYYYSGFHLGYLAYSPWGWTPSFYGYPYGYGNGYGYGYGGYPYRGYEFGSVKIKVKPRDAEVYVDGYFAGDVDDFDGAFQSLKLESGAYRIEIRKPGFETLQFDVQVQPERTITYRGEMQATP